MRLELLEASPAVERESNREERHRRSSRNSFLAAGNAGPIQMRLRLDERAGTVAITYDFRPCSSN